MSITSNILNIGDGYSSALSSIGNIGRAAGGYANQIQSLLGSDKKGSSSKIRALYTNGFFAQDKLFSPRFFVRAFDEPTYLTFRLEFITDPNETRFRNTAYNNAGALGTIENSILYSTMFDYMPEPFLEDYINVYTTIYPEKDSSTGKDASTGKTYSTEAYLDLNLGDHGRAALLHNFKAALKDIEENFPFYFKSISGLSSLATVDPANGARVKDGEITIECEEGIDLKITQLINMYRKIVWDDTYQRWVLPDMMRYFGMRIYISEIRLFHNMRKQSSWNNKSFDIFRNINKGDTYDFSNEDIRNAYSFPIDKSKQWEFSNDALAKGTAISNAFLGTKSIITQALNYARGKETTEMDVLSGIDDVFNDMMLCNNVINDVMPTICLECHMCEFDISRTLNHLDAQYNNTHDSKKVSPSITIKVGQVKENHAYPLNRFLTEVNGKYGVKIPNVSDIKSLDAVISHRNNDMGYVGQYVSDDVLNKKYSSAILKERIDEYNRNLRHSMGDTDGLRITRRRLGNKMIDELENMNYSKEGSSKIAAESALTAALLNEATDIAGRIGISSDLIGTKSLATDQQKYIIDGMTAIGETLKDAADKIYNGAELKSLALTDYMHAQIANKLFDEYIDKLEETAEEGSALEKVLQSYKMVKLENMPRSTATSKKEISGFGFING